MSKPEPTFFARNYPDTFLDWWVRQSETRLCKPHAAKYNVQQGFEILRKTEEKKSLQDTRSRANEVLRAGFLTASIHGVKNVGWMSLQSGQSIHTRLGYCAYAIGKAIQGGGDELPSVQNGASALFAIILLQTGFKYGDRHILTSSLFHYILRRFLPPTGYEVNNSIWKRRMASVMFSSLSQPSTRQNLVTFYLNDSPITKFPIQMHKGSSTVSSAELAGEKFNLTIVVSEKTGLYWIGGSEDKDSRKIRGKQNAKTRRKQTAAEGKLASGWFTLAFVTGGKILTLAEQMERESIQAGSENPFAFLIAKPEDGETVCVLEKLTDIFSARTEAREEWSRLMKTLHEGVIESLRFIESTQSTTHARTFYTPDDEVGENVGDDLVLEVDKNMCPLPPKLDDVVAIRENKFLIKKIDELNEKLQLHLRRA